jgi:hypothetical protein
MQFYNFSQSDTKDASLRMIDVPDVNVDLVVAQLQRAVGGLQKSLAKVKAQPTNLAVRSPIFRGAPMIQ